MHSLSSLDHRRAGDQLQARVVTVGTILRDMRLDIPSYQRPYTWSRKNVTQLVDDMRRFRYAGHYRIGTFILHEPAHDETSDGPLRGARGEHRRRDIVDGQQRFLSFALIAAALLKCGAELDDRITDDLQSAVECVRIPDRRDGRSSGSLRSNYSHLCRIISRWDEDELRDFTDFFLADCTVVVLDVRDLDAAFQMFDSQNSRGRPLYPTDLLKAYHLREFSRTDPSREAVLSTVREWESVPPDEINHVIAAVLFPIKQWSEGRPLPRDGFTAHHVDAFKGIREDVHGNGRYRWARPVLLAKAAVDRFARDNSTLLRHGAVDELKYPFQITQPVIDGEMFFRMVRHYVLESRRAGIVSGSEPPRSGSREKKPRELPEQLDEQLAHVYPLIDGMPPGTGNRYVRELFDCLLMAYVDRFGWHEVDPAARRLARYAYLLRVHLSRIQVGSVDMHARRGHDRIRHAEKGDFPTVNVFAEMARALDHRFILDIPIPLIKINVAKELSDPLRALYAVGEAPAQREAPE